MSHSTGNVTGAAENGRRRSIDSLFVELQRAGSPGMAVGVYWGGHVTSFHGYGCADLEHGVPITSTTVFHVASVSKQFTAFAIALLARDGLVDLDADVRTYLPFVPDFGSAIRVRHLIHHTSGLRDQWTLFDLGGQGVDNRLRQRQILNMVARQRALNFEPGTEYLYSNTGYTLLAEIVGTVSGRTFRQFTKERIFAPLQMTNTFFYDDVTEIVPGRAHSYTRIASGGGWRRGLLNYENVGATALLTTAEDMVKWAGNFAHPRVGDSQLIEQIGTPGALRDGKGTIYGFALERRYYAGHEALLHYGADAGFQAVFAYFPAKDFSVCMLANHPPDDWTRLIEGMVDLHLNEGAGEPQDYGPAAVTPDDALLQELAGHYSGAFDPMITLEPHAGRLLLRIAGGEPKEVVFRADGSFDVGRGRRTWSYYRAQRNTAGRVVAIQDLGQEVYSSAKLYRRIEPVSRRPEELAELAGKYHSAELDITYSLTVEDGRLTATSLWSPRPITFTPSSEDRFDSEHFSMQVVEVVRDAQRRPTALRVHGVRIRHVLLDRLSTPEARPA
jgi:CubicO group peptidase (beta-lactamase class C family)